MPEARISFSKEQWQELLKQNWDISNTDIAKRVKKHRLVIQAWIRGEEVESNSGMGKWYLARKPLFWYGHKYRVKEKGTVYEKETLDSLSVWGSNVDDSRV